jgi:hypothetical protein
MNVLLNAYCIITGVTKRQIGKGKGVKFHKVFKSLPNHIQDMFTNHASTTGAKQKTQRAIIDELVVHEPDGTYSLNVTAPMFEDCFNLSLHLHVLYVYSYF